MLRDKEAVATIAVRDLKTARPFYEGTLGLVQNGPGESGVVSFKSGNSSILVYESQFAGTNKATTVNWIAGDDLEAIVQELKKKGVTFEHYDLPGTKREGDIHVADETRVVWFKDPDGNILSIVSP